MTFSLKFREFYRDVPYAGVNADNLHDALSCFIDYGEGDINDIGF